MSQNYSPETVTKDLVMCIDGTQGFKGYNAVRKPTKIGGCVLWLDGDDPSSIVHSGNAVSSWNDKSNNGNNATQSTASKKPTYSSSELGGKGGLVFDSSASQTLNAGDSSSIDVTGSITIFVVQRLAGDAPAATFVPVHKDVQFSIRAVTTATTPVIQWADSTQWSYANFGSYNAAVGASHPSIIACKRDGGTSTVSGFINGARSYNKTFGSGGITATANNLYIGSYADNSSFYDGCISEVIIYNRSLSDSERQQVEFYLSKKWDIPLLVSYNASSQRWPLDLTSNANNSGASSTHTWTSPSVNAARGIFRQNNSDRYVIYTTPAAISNIAAKGGFTIEWAAAAIYHDTSQAGASGTNYNVVNNESYQNDGFILRYGGSNWGQPYVRVNHAGGTTTSSGGRVPAADNTVAGEWAHWCFTFLNGSGQNSIATFYKNNVEVEQFTNWEVPEADATNSLSFLGTGQGFCGELAFLRLYQKALTSKERQTNYLAMSERINSIPKIARPRDVQLYLDANQYKNFGASTWFDMAARAGNSVGGTVAAVSRVGAADYNWPKCYSFDGTDSVITNWTAYDYDDSAGEFTMCAWINPDNFTANSGTYLAILNRSDGTTHLHSLYLASSTGSYTGSMASWIFNTAGAQSSFSSVGNCIPNLGEWNFCVWRWKDAVGYTWDLFNSDGHANYTQSSSVISKKDSTSQYTIGEWRGHPTSGNGGYRYEGDIANVMEYNVKLTDSEVLQNYNYFKNRFGK